MALLRHTRRAYAQDRKSTVDPNCIIVGSLGSLAGLDTDDSDSDDAGSIDDSTVSVDENGNTTIVFDNPEVIEGDIQSGMTTVNSDCLETAEFTGYVGIGLDIAAVAVGSALGITEGLAVAAIVYDLLAAGFLAASKDPPAPATASLKLFRQPKNSPALSPSLSPLAARLQLSTFHATSMRLAITAFTTSHERYLTAVQQAVAKPNSQTVPAVKAQALAMASNASACAGFCAALSSDMQQLSSLLSRSSAPSTTLSFSQIATGMVTAWPSQQSVLAKTFNYGPNSLAAATEVSQAIATTVRNLKTLQVRGAQGMISTSQPLTPAQLAQLTSAAGTSLSSTGTSFSGLAQTINNAKWPNGITVTLPPPPSCPPLQTMVHGKCVKGETP